MQNTNRYHLKYFILVIFLLAFPHSQPYLLEAVSGSDGPFTDVYMDSRWVHVTDTNSSGGGYYIYMYFQVTNVIPAGTLYLEVDYKDVGIGDLKIQYNAFNPVECCRRPLFSYHKFRTDSGTYRTAVFKLTDADFYGGLNMGSDLRIDNWYPETQLHIVEARLYTSPTPLWLSNDQKDWIGPYTGTSYSDVDVSTIQGKALTGYQGWFRALGDGAEAGWGHWSRNSALIASNTLTVDMWPDMSEYTAAEKYAVPGFTHPDGSQAYLFSSVNRETVIRHFEWMKQYGIDGAGVQRFLVGCEYPDESILTRVLANAREAANLSGRAFVVDYDLSGMDTNDIFTWLTNDWRFLREVMQITSDPRYVHEDSLPVLKMFGFYPSRFSSSLAAQIISYFQSPGPQQVFLWGSGDWDWYDVIDPGWPAVYRSFDAYTPWNVGNYSDTNRWPSMAYWDEDIDEAHSNGMLYLPVAYPGFTWDNLKQTTPGSSLTPRRRGDFYWQQISRAAEIGADGMWLAMFDETDEGTAIFKVTDTPPVQAYFVGMEGLPSDCYLSLAGEGTRMFRGEIPYNTNCPDCSLMTSPSIPVITSPSSGSSYSNASAFFSWLPSIPGSNISHYEINFNSNICVMSGTNFSTNLPDGTWTWQLRAVNDLGNPSAWTLPRVVYSTNTPPPEPLIPTVDIPTFRIRPSIIAATDQTAVIEGIPADAKQVSIFNLNGDRRIILTISGRSVSWTVRDEEGKRLEPGTYIIKAADELIYFSVTAE